MFVTGDGPAVAITVQDEVVKTMRARLQILDSKTQSEESCTIYRVLPSIRDHHRKDYDPKIISIGPFHQKKEALQTMEQLKWRYLQDFLTRCQEETMLEKFIKRVRELENQARKQYSQLVVEPNSDSFIQLMVVDGCFIIELLIKLYFGDKNRGQLAAENWNIPLIKNDLLLLENQIPFFILQSLFELSGFHKLDPEEVNDITVTLLKLVVAFVTRDKFESVPKALDPETVHHLLHLFHISLHPTSHQAVPVLDSSSCGHLMMHAIKKMLRCASISFFQVLSLLVKCCHHPVEERSRAPRMFPSATRLKESGIKFRKEKKATTLLDIKFGDGMMEIPVLAIQEDTPAKFRNLIAFEQCCPKSGNHFTSYATFLNNLIDTPEDVALLKECGIIESKLGQDKEVADLFNKLCQGAYLNFEKHYLVKLFKDVKCYCETDRHRWRAGLMHYYLGNPWAIISLIAATFLLILTVLQTFFAVYAYYRPPS